MLTSEARESLLRRLRKIEGQTQGIQRMLVDGRDCREVLDQLASVRAATRRVGQELMKHYLLARLSESELHSPEETVGDMIEVLSRV